MNLPLGNSYTSYNSSLKLTGLKKMSARRKQICLTFAKKSLKHKKFNFWFQPNTKKTTTRQEQPQFCNVYSRLTRFEKSPLSHLTELLNQHRARKTRFWRHKNIIVTVNYRGIKGWDWGHCFCLFVLLFVLLITWQIITIIIIIMRMLILVFLKIYKSTFVH